MPSGLLFTMSRAEIDRLSVVKQVIQKQIKQKDGAKLLRVSDRQMRRLLRSYQENGVKGLISKKRGRLGNHHHRPSKKEKTKKLIGELYSDFGPTFASEKLAASHKIIINKETLRQWMMEWGFWQSDRQKKIKIHQSRNRRECLGELVQIDGSHHDWFEGRAEKCCLYVFIDDATSRLMGLHFEKTETTVGYFKLARSYIQKFGRPRAFYGDKSSIFRATINKTNSETQWGRAMRELNIEMICANSPQAKGRVEKANQTLQNRLIKEMRLQKINNIKAANAYLPHFIEDWNKRFTVKPTKRMNAHRKELPTKSQLDFIFSIQEDRKLSKNLQMSYGNMTYQIKENSIGGRLRHAYVTICKKLSGEINVLYKGTKLDYIVHQKPIHILKPETVDSKQIMDIKKSIRKDKKPWVRYAKQATRKQLSANESSR